MLAEGQLPAGRVEGAVLMPPKLTATNKNTEEKGCLWVCICHALGMGVGWGGGQSREAGKKGEELEAILLSQWKAGWKRPSFLAFCHQVMRKLHDQ